MSATGSDRRASATAQLKRFGPSITAVTGGGAIALSLPPFGWWPTALLGFGLLRLVTKDAAWRARAWRGFCAGIGQFAIGLYWAKSFTLVGYVALIICEALFVALACLVARHGSGPTAFAAAIGLCERLRDQFPFGGLPIGSAALGQAFGPLATLTRLGGPVLLVVATASIGAGVSESLWELAKKTRERQPDNFSKNTVKHLFGPGVFALGCIVATIAPSGGPPQRFIEIAAIQGGGVLGKNQSQVFAREVLARASQTTMMLRRGQALVLWPEDTVALDGPIVSNPVTATIGTLAHQRRTTLVVGFTATVGTNHYRNEIVAFGPSGKIVATFEKVHAVPFGEYVPERGLLQHLFNFSAVPRDVITGKASGEIDTPAGRFALLVSFEDFFSSRGLSAVKAGGQAILVPTNTSSYSSDQVPSQELAASALQAIGEGRDLLQASPTGYSAFVDPQGRVLLRTVLSKATAISGRLGLRDGSTVFDSIGSLPIELFCFLWLMASWGRRLPQATSRRGRLLQTGERLA